VVKGLARGSQYHIYKIDRARIQNVREKEIESMLEIALAALFAVASALIVDWLRRPARRKSKGFKLSVEFERKK